MAAAREPRSEYERTVALVHVQYELEMCAASAVRAAYPNDRDDEIEANAYLESTLLHARNLYEFLVADRKSPRDDDLLRTDFTLSDWTASEHAPEAVRRLAAAIPDVHKHLSHLTWARVVDVAAVAWTPLQIADDVAQLVRAWAIHLSAHERGGVGEAHGHSTRSQPPSSGDQPAEVQSEAPTRANARGPWTRWPTQPAARAPTRCVHDHVTPLACEARAVTIHPELTVRPDVQV